MEWKLGTQFKQLTAAVGIEPCQKCNERAEKLDRWSRRGFVGLLSAGLGILITPRLVEAVSTSTDALPSEALQLLRVLNTQQAWFKKRGRHAALWEMFNDLEQYNWKTKHTNLEERYLEILPGWMFEFHLVNANAYVIVLYQKVDQNDPFAPRTVLVSDQTGGIYIAERRDPEQPKARELNRAKDFPNVEPFTGYNIKMSFGGPVARFLFRTVQAGGCLGCCYADQCCGSCSECGGGGVCINCGIGGCSWCTSCNAWCADKKVVVPPTQCGGQN